MQRKHLQTATRKDEMLGEIFYLFIFHIFMLPLLQGAQSGVHGSFSHLSSQQLDEVGKSEK